jgi:hypothetical protein
VQPHGEVGDLPGGPGGRVARACAALAQLRRHHLLDQVRLPVDRGLDRAQVPGLDAELPERGHRTRHRERVGTVLPADPPDQAVLLELGQLRLADARRLDELAAGQVRGGLPARPSRAGAVPALAPVSVTGQPFPDHPQRKVGVPLHGEDVPQSLDVRRAEPAVPRA